MLLNIFNWQMAAPSFSDTDVTETTHRPAGLMVTTPLAAWRPEMIRFMVVMEMTSSTSGMAPIPIYGGDGNDYIDDAPATLQLREVTT